MSTHMDAHALDHVWDAQVLGKPLPLSIDDPDERQLLDLLATAARPAPSPAFTQMLGDALELESTKSVGTKPPGMPYDPTPRGASSLLDRWQLSRPHYVKPIYALAAILLVLLAGSALYVRQAGRIEEPRSIPAVSDWAEEGPPSSAGIEAMPLFSHTYSVDELAGYDVEDWGWFALIRGSAMPGQEAWAPYDPGLVATSPGPGLSVVGIESGGLTFQAAKTVFISRGVVPDLIPVSPGEEVTLGAGDALIYGQAALAKVWNSTDEVTRYLAGGFYPRPDAPLRFPAATMDLDDFGTSIDSAFLESAEMLKLTLTAVTIGPGETFAYSIQEDSLLVGALNGDGLRQQRWSAGKQDGPARTLVDSSYAFHQDPAGYYTLTNTGTQPIEMSFIRLTAAEPTQPVPSP